MKDQIFLDKKSNTHYTIDHTKYPHRSNVRVLYLKSVYVDGIIGHGVTEQQFTQTYFDLLIENKILVKYEDTTRKKSK